MTTRLITAAGHAVPHTVTTAELLAHFERAGFLYPTKRARIAPLMPLIEAGWPRLLAAADDLCMTDVVEVDGVVRVSHALFRMSGAAVAAHHAANEGVPGAFLGPLGRQLIAAQSLAGVRFVAMFVRPTNRWAARIARAADSVTPAGSPAALTHAYLVARPDRLPPLAAPPPAAPPPAAPTAARVADSALGAAAALVAAVWGPDRAASRGFTATGLDPQLAAICRAAGLDHAHRVWGVAQDGRMVGIAHRSVVATPMNLSLLDRRAEIIVVPGLADRAPVVAALARAVVEDARRRGEPIVTLLVDGSDAAAAAEAGFEDDGMAYVEHLWPVDVTTDAVAAFGRIYAAAQRHAVVLPAHGVPVTPAAP